MTTVILAEKPSQALAYATAFQSSEKNEGFFNIKDPMFYDETLVTFGFGHLVELATPREYKEECHEKNHTAGDRLFPHCVFSAGYCKDSTSDCTG